MPEIPHFKYPFQFVAGRVPTVEQDSVDEVEQCVEVVLRYPTGLRIDLPNFGAPEQVFRQGVSLADLEGAVSLWEPRAAAALTQTLDPQDELATRVRVLLKARSASG